MAKSNVEKALDQFGKYIIQQSKSNLTREKHKDTSVLYNSLGYDLKVSKRQSIELTINMEDYGDFVDKGVKGTGGTKADGSSWKLKKVTNSKYKFNSSKSSIPVDSIMPWIKRKRLQWRKPNGTFTSFKQTAWAYAKSIHATGLKTTNFLTTPFERAFKRLPDEIVEAYALDMDKFFETTSKNARI